MVSYIWNTIKIIFGDGSYQGFYHLCLWLICGPHIFLGTYPHHGQVESMAENLWLMRPGCYSRFWGLTIYGYVLTNGSVYHFCSFLAHKYFDGALLLGATIWDQVHKQLVDQIRERERESQSNLHETVLYKQLILQIGSLLFNLHLLRQLYWCYTSTTINISWAQFNKYAMLFRSLFCKKK